MDRTHLKIGNKFATVLNTVLRISPVWQQLPPKTARFWFHDDYDPTKQTWREGAVWTLVDADKNIWDYYHDTTVWYYGGPAISSNTEFMGQISSSDYEILGVNGTGITDTSMGFAPGHGISNLKSAVGLYFPDTTTVQLLFAYQQGLSKIELITGPALTNMITVCYRCWGLKEFTISNAENVTSMTMAFWGSGLEIPPYFETPNCTDYSMAFEQSDLKQVVLPGFIGAKATDTDGMFNQCHDVESGMVNLYNYCTQLPSLSNHAGMFYQCGDETETGIAERALIPDDWK